MENFLEKGITISNLKKYSPDLKVMVMCVLIECRINVYINCVKMVMEPTTSVGKTNQYRVVKS